MISGKEFAEKNFSQIEETKEKLFSTGNEELDNLLAEVYYSGIEDGYDYAQKEFGARERKQRRKAQRKEQNSVMHANKAANKAKQAEKLAREASTVEEAKAAESVLATSNKLANTAISEAGGNASVVEKAMENKGVNPKKVEGKIKFANAKAQLAKTFKEGQKKATELGKKGLEVAKKNPLATAAVTTTAGALVAAGAIKGVKKKRENK